MPLPSTNEEQETLAEIRKVAFGTTSLCKNDHTDARNVFTARKYGGIFVTLDGALLRSAKTLHRRFGVQVMSPEQAVSMVRIRIAERDGMARRDAERERLQLPEWVGSD